MESLIIAVQDQALNMCYHQKNIMKQPNDSKQRMCYNAEHTKHSVVGCINHAPSEYSNIYNKVSGYIHRTICKHMGLQVTNRYYEHISERIININGTTIMWDASVITDWIILENQPATVLCDKKVKTCLLIDITIPHDSNVITKETENFKTMFSYMYNVWELHK
jgi:hypothetical protein